MHLKSGDYLTNGVQKIIKPKMRFVLVDWMSQVCHDNCLMRETFYYSVYILDRFLSRTPLTDISELQLIGLTSLVLACKIEEVRPPSIYVMLTYCLNIYSDRDLRLCEIRIGKVASSQAGGRLDAPDRHSLHLDRPADEFLGSVRFGGI